MRTVISNVGHVGDQLLHTVWTACRATLRRLSKNSRNLRADLRAGTFHRQYCGPRRRTQRLSIVSQAVMLFSPLVHVVGDRHKVAVCV